MEEKLKSLNCELYETAADIGRLNSAKSQLERDVDELAKRMGDYENTFFGKESAGKTVLKVLPRVDICQGWLYVISSKLNITVNIFCALFFLDGILGWLV